MSGKEGRLKVGQALSCADLGSFVAPSGISESPPNPRAGPLSNDDIPVMPQLGDGTLKPSKGPPMAVEPSAGRRTSTKNLPRSSVHFQAGEEKRELKPSPDKHSTTDAGKVAHALDARSSLGANAVLQEVAAYTPFWLWHSAASRDTSLSVPEVTPVMAGVMFADVSGFTKLTESLAESARDLHDSRSAMGGAEQLTLIINRYFDRMISVIVRYGGDVLKFAGDAMLVMFPASTVRCYFL